MKKLTDKIYGIIIIIICIINTKGCLSDHIEGGNNKAISNYEQMIFNKTKTIAELYPEYNEVTVKVMNMPIKSYEFRYHFNIDETKYEGGHSFDSILPKSNKIEVYYLKEDPNFNCVNPAERLAEEKEKNSTKKNLYWAIGWGLLGLFTLMGLFVKDKE